jgi:hypothetical protein
MGEKKFETGVKWKEKFAVLFQHLQASSVENGLNSTRKITTEKTSRLQTLDPLLDALNYVIHDALLSNLRYVSYSFHMLYV